MRTFLAAGKDLMEVHVERGAELFVLGSAFMGSSLSGKMTTEWFRSFNARRIVADAGPMHVWLAHPFGGRVVQVECEEDVWVKESALLGWTPDARVGRRPRGMWVPAAAGSTIFLGMAGQSVTVDLAYDEGWRMDAMRVVATQSSRPISEAPIFWDCHANGIREGTVNLIGPMRIWAETVQIDHPKLRKIP